MIADAKILRAEVKLLKYLFVEIVLGALLAATALGANNTYTGPDGNYGADVWPVDGNWSENKMPRTTDNVFIPTNIEVSATGLADPDTYTGNLTLSNSAFLTISSQGGTTNGLKILGTPGSTVIHAYEDARIIIRVGGATDFVVPAIELHGDFRDFSMSRSVASSSHPDFNYPISGPYTFTLNGSHDDDIADLNASNSFAHLRCTAQYGIGNVNANVPGSLGSGDVTIEENPSDGKRCMTLTINTNDTMADSCTLTINGPNSTDRITMNGDDTIAELFLDNVRQDAGTYGRIGNTNVDYQVLWCLGDGILTVTGPTLSYWDTNSTTSGSGGPAPAGTWDGTNTYWNPNPTGTAATAAWNPGDMAAFAAGTDASGSYTVTVSGTQDISGVYFEEGTVTLAGGALRMTGQSYFNVADGLTATLSSVVTNDATAWKFIKSGDGTLVPTEMNTYSGPTRIEGGTMVVSNLQPAGAASLLGAYPDSDPDGLVLAGGGTLRYTGGSATNDRGLNMQGDGNINIVNDDTVLVLSTSKSSEVEGTLTVTGGSGSRFEMGPLNLMQGVGLTLKPVDVSMAVTSVMGSTEYPYPNPYLVLSGTSTGNVIEGSISRNTDPPYSRPVTVEKRGPGTWTCAGQVSESTYTYEGTLILAATNTGNLAHWLYSGTLIFAENRALGTWMNDFEIGVANGGSDATFLISGPHAFEEHRSIRIVCDDTEDTGGRTITIGGCTADESYFRNWILLGNDDSSEVAYGISLTAASGGVVTFEEAILEPTNTQSSAYMIKKIGEGTVVFAGTNNYTGDTSVEAGVLSLATNGTLDDASTLYITNNAKVNIAAGVDQTVADMYLGGVAAFHGYTYGGTNSAADFKLDTWFTGTGVITIAGVRDGLCSITNTSATDVTQTSATFHAILTVTNIATDVYVHWGPTDGTNDFGAWSNSAPVGVYTTAFSEAISFTTNGLSGDTTYYYTFRATNAVTNIWATSSISFTTLSAPQVNNSSGGTEESETTATIRGRLTAGAQASAWICWGDEDGGDDSTSGWDNVISMGTVDESSDFTTLASGLIPNITYWYRCYVTNALGVAWSESASFSSIPVDESEGGIAIYTHSVTEEDVLNPEGGDDYDLNWNTTVRQSAEYALDYSGGRVNVTADAGHHLVMHSARYDTGRNGSGRVEAHHYILVDGQPVAAGWASGYADNWGDRNDVIYCGGGIIYLPSSGTVSIQAHRTDDEYDDDDVDRIGNASGLQLLKLDDSWDYCRLSRSTAQVGPASTTYVDVQYDSQDELDTGSFGHTAGSADITLKTAGHYLVLVNTYMFQDTGTGSHIRHRLTLNGTEVAGSLTGQVIKETDSSCNEGAATLGIIIETSATNEVLNVEVALDASVSPTFIMPDKTAVTMVKLPDDGDYIRLHNADVNTITNFNAASTLAMDWDTADELDTAAFAGSYATPDSVITTVVEGDYIFFATLYENNTGGDATYLQRWSTNGVSDPIAYAVGGECTQLDEGGSFSGLIVGMQSNSTLEVVSESVSYPGSPGVHNGYSAGLWGMRLESIMPGSAINNTAPTNVTEYTAWLNAELTAPATNFTVYVYWGPTNGGTTIGSWEGSAEVGAYTNAASASITYYRGDLAPGSTNWYTYRAVNGSTNIWAVPSWKFVTKPVWGLGVGNLGASSVADTNATLNAAITCLNTNGDVYVYWGPSNGATNPAAWTNDAYVGSWTNTAASTNISYAAGSLTEATQYYYTFFISNATTNVWASPSLSFTTIAQPGVNNSTGPTVLSETSATLRGELTNGILADAWICWGENDAGTNSTADWDHAVSMGSVAQGVPFATTLTEVYSGIGYDYRVYVTNSAGEAWSEVTNFFTLSPRRAWTPSNMTSIAWYDASETNTIDYGTLNGTNYVQVWHDKTTNDLDLIDAGLWANINSDPNTGARTINGLNVLDSDGGDYLYHTAFPVPASGDISIFAVAAIDDAADQWESVFAMDAATNDFQFDAGDTSFSGRIQSSDLGIAEPLNLTGGPYEGDTNIFNAVFDKTAGTCEVYITGTNVASDSSYVNALSTSQTFRVFASRAGNNQIDGAMGEVILIEDCTTDTRQKTEGYLAHKWGLEGNLPADHPNSTRPATIWNGDFGVLNTTATNITGTTADLRGTLFITQSVFDVTVYWSTNNNADAAAWLADGAASSASAGSYTNVMSYSVTGSVSSLSEITRYYYTFMITNECTNYWAPSNGMLNTLGLPTVDNDGGGTGLTETNATIRGELTAGGVADAWICWGTIDGGTASTSAWQNVVPIGSVGVGVVFSTNVTGLATNQSYWYRCYVTNSYGVDWSDTAESFSGIASGGGGGGAGGSDFKIQRGEVDIPWDQTTVTITNGVDYEAPASLNSAFIRIVNNRLSAAGGRPTHEADEVTVSISNPENLLNSITFERYMVGTAANEFTRITWEIIEYIASAGGPNEMIVRDQGQTNMAAGTATVTGAVVSAVSDDNDIVVFITGQRTSATTSGDMDHALHTSHWLAGSDQPSFTRSQTAGSSASVSYAVVEWKGANWAVQRVTHDQLAANVEETESITNSVNSAARTFIHAQVRSSEGQLDEQGLEIWLSDTNQVSFFLENGALVVQDAVVWIVENTETDPEYEMKVQHLQYGDPGAADGVYWTNSIPTPVNNITNTSVMGENGRCTGTGTTWPSGVINMRIVSTNEVQCWYVDDNQTPTYRYSIVEWPSSLGTAAIANAAPTGITDSAATFNAALTAPDEEYYVYVYWGLTNGGTNVSGWTSDAYVGYWTNAVTNVSFSTNGLTGSTTNWYTFTASNSTVGRVWAEPSWMFLTPSPGDTAPGWFFEIE